LFKEFVLFVCTVWRMRGREVVFIEYHGVPNPFFVKNTWTHGVGESSRESIHENLLYCTLALLNMCTMHEGTWEVRAWLF
jgi:hypothetical protein